MALRTLEGQATELGWRRDGVTDLTPEDYLDLIMHKTCWYTTIHPLRVGALIGSRRPGRPRPLVRFGFHLGAAFQIQDDLLNLVGDEAAYGKEIDGDLYEGKRTPHAHPPDAARRGCGPAPPSTATSTLDPAERGPRTIVAEIRALMDVLRQHRVRPAYAAGIAGVAARDLRGCLRLGAARARRPSSSAR